MKSSSSFTRLAVSTWAVAMFCMVLPTGSASAQKGGTTPPPNPEILYHEGLKTIKVANADGSNIRTVLSAGKYEYFTEVSWGPTGNSLVFHCQYASGGYGVYTANLDGTNKRRVTVTALNYTYPKWSSKPGPHGQHLIAYSDKGPTGSIADQRDIFVVNPDGTGKVNVTNTPDDMEVFSAWSRDGSRLYVDCYDYLKEIILGVDGGGNVTVASEQIVWTKPWNDTLGRLEAANLSDKLVFQVSSSPFSRIYILDLSVPSPSARLVTLLTTGDESSPSLSPDDSRIVFFRSGTSGGIFTVNTDGSDERRIVPSGKGTIPDWKRPVPTVP